MKPVRQLTKDEARDQFDYSDGMLFWRYGASGRRSDMRAMTVQARSGNRRDGKKHYYVTIIGGERYCSQYLVWNWHNGKTDNAIIFNDGDALNCRIENLKEVPRGHSKLILGQSYVDEKDAREFIVGQSYAGNGDQSENNIVGQSYAGAGSCCPTCAQPVSVPTYDYIVQHLELQPLHARILKAIWDGKGHPVLPPRIFNYIYEDDIDGGPSGAAMYSNFKVALCRLRTRLEGSGISIVTVGYRKGYRLVMEGKK